jgi:hypothetical protein
LQSASGYDYSVVGFATFPNGGSFDPQGKISILRSWQGIDANGQYTAPTPSVDGGVYKPANSGFDKHNGAKLGSFTAGYPGDCTPDASTLEVQGYGREIIQMVYTAYATNNLPVVIATQYIQLYPNTPTEGNPPTATYSNTLSPSGPLLTFTPNVSNPPVPVNVYQGNNLPRITAQITNLYPGSTSWLSIYPGDPLSNPTRTGAVPIVNSTMTDTVDNGFWERTLANAHAFTFDLGTALVACGINQAALGAQTYTVEAIQKLPAAYDHTAGCVSNQNVVSSITFSVDLKFGINTQLGK